MAQQGLVNIEKVDLRSIFPNETTNMTPWMAEGENIALLSDTIGIDLSVADREVPVGAFSADLQATSEDSSSGIPDVVIENQFGDTNHDHLGKCITYAAGLGVKKIVWVAENFRAEHRSALAWLNENSKEDVDFFGATIRAIRIGNSEPAIEFGLVIAPDGWRRRTQSATANPRGEMYRKYWELLIPMLRDEEHIRHHRRATIHSYITVPAGVPGIVYGLNFRTGGRIGVDLYFESDAETNSRLFSELNKQRESIETELGSELSWEPLENRKACRIATYGEGAIDDDDSSLERHRTWMLEALGNLKHATQSRLADVANDS